MIRAARDMPVLSATAADLGHYMELFPGTSSTITAASTDIAVDIGGHTYQGRLENGHLELHYADGRYQVDMYDASEADTRVMYLDTLYCYTVAGANIGKRISGSDLFSLMREMGYAQVKLSDASRVYYRIQPLLPREGRDVKLLDYGHEYQTITADDRVDTDAVAGMTGISLQLIQLLKVVVYNMAKDSVRTYSVAASTSINMGLRDAAVDAAAATAAAAEGGGAASAVKKRKPATHWSRRPSRRTSRKVAPSPVSGRGRAIGTPVSSRGRARGTPASASSASSASSAGAGARRVLHRNRVVPAALNANHSLPVAIINGDAGSGDVSFIQVYQVHEEIEKIERTLLPESSLTRVDTVYAITAEASTLTPWKLFSDEAPVGGGGGGGAASAASAASAADLSARLTKEAEGLDKVIKNVQKTTPETVQIMDTQLFALYEHFGLGKRLHDAAKVYLNLLQAARTSNTTSSFPKVVGTAGYGAWLDGIKPAAPVTPAPAAPAADALYSSLCSILKF